jgi:ribosomal protein S8
MRKSQGKEEPIKNLGIDILLKYKNQQPIINKINMISKPSQKVYNKLEDIQNLVHPTSPSRIGGGGKGHSPIQGL